MEQVVITEWGYKRDHKNRDKLVVNIRSGTTDEKVVKEVLMNNVYQRRFRQAGVDFVIEAGERWLDLGSNIGTFALLALTVGASVECVEATSINYELLADNLCLNGFSETLLYKGCVVHDKYKGDTCTIYTTPADDYNQYRHGMFKITKRHTLTERPPAIKFSSILTKGCCVKMDIEGAEIDILDKVSIASLRKIKKLVFEYSFDVDPSIPRFKRIISKLRQVFKFVHHPPLPSGDRYELYPSGILVFAM